eukprot:366804-Prymnesium_polylepis.1
MGRRGLGGERARRARACVARAGRRRTRETAKEGKDRSVSEPLACAAGGSSRQRNRATEARARRAWRH